ncbi:MAG: hypothetical protein AAGF92_22405 [Myxococcota bacterium]
MYSPNLASRRRAIRTAQGAWLTLLFLLTACGSSDTNSTGGSGGSGGTAGTGGSAGVGGTGGAEVDPVFAICAFTFDPTQLIGLVGTLPSIDADQEFDRSDAFDFSGRPICAAYGGALFVSDPESPSVTRYDLDDAGSLVRGETVSFANFGLGPLSGIQPELMQFISDERAYFIDRAQRIAVIWNPTTMVVIDSVELPVETPDGLVPAGGGGIATLGTTIVIPFAFLTDLGVNASTTVFVFLDTTTDTVTTDTFPDCGGIQNARTVANGDTYFASNAVSAANFRLGLPDSFPPCLARLPAGATAIDRDFELDLRDLVDGAPAASMLAGPGDSGFLTAYDESLVPITGDEDAGQIVVADAWRVYRAEQTGVNAPATLVTDLPVGAGRLGGLVADGRTYIFLPAADLSGSTAYDVTDAAAVEAITASSLIYYVARLR